MIEDLFADIVPAKTLQISISKQWKNGIELTAPLAVNLNDKGSAFAGSVSSILTLAGWALITRQLDEAGLSADVMVVESATQFSAAIRSNLIARAETTEAEMTRVLKELEQRGRSRIRIESTIQEHASMTASFAVILP